MSFESEWRSFFESDEECHRYDMFMQRSEAEQRGEVLEHTPEELARKTKEEHYVAYESTEHYREAWAKKKGYKFSPKPYDRDEKYQGIRL